ncbi:MAG TPA: Gfo/Idh/MocA family oxidoreductase [Verrucomicrobiota bacterium]|nr:Gfo/Idh/MocA family oxidoreductase [Verrucomicrobiota bacterium]HNU51459.1 Gfo/Idh/MocA family oxidoreductase [Verrucomicrobiota bacterium]
MSTPYTVLVVGMGKRGMHHAVCFNANPRFKVVGLCDIDPARLAAAAAKLGDPATGSDAAALARSLKPDVFCFTTLPNLRMPMIRAGIESGAKLLAFEKPVALTSAELFAIRELIRGAGVKAVVSHQHRYGVHYRKVRDLVAGGALGRVHTVYGSATGWMTHMLSHLIDYTCWFNDYAPAAWVMAQAAGRRKLADNHPSPDYIAGFVQFANGVRGIYECGAGAPDQPEVAKWWGKNRLGAQGTEGFAEVLTNGGWRAVTAGGGAQSGEGAMNYDLDMPPYIQEMADWLDDGSKAHSCQFERACQGAEIMLAMQRSAVDGGQVALPLATGMDEQALLRDRLEDRPVVPSCEANRKEFGL